MNLIDVQGIPLLDGRAWLSALAVLGIAYFFGAIGLFRVKQNVFIDLLLLRVSCGLAITSVGVLLIGQIGEAAFKFPWPIVAVLGGLIFCLHCFMLFRAGREEGSLKIGEEADKRSELVIAGWAGWLGVAATMILLLGPAFSPPVNYDTLEYHLGVVPHYFSAGRIEPIPHIFYSAQPMATEMLYTLGAICEGSPWGLSSGLIQWSFIGIGLLLLWRTLLNLKTPSAIIPWLLLCFLSHPIIFKLELDRLTDITGGVFLGAGLLLLTEEETDTRSFLLAGLFAGAAITTKWTNAGTSALILSSITIFKIVRLYSRKLSVMAGSLGAFVGGGALVLLPWVGWLWKMTGNPIAPFGASHFSSPAWNANQLKFLLETHGQLSVLASDYWINLYRRGMDLSTGAPVGIAAALIWLVLVMKRNRDRVKVDAENGNQDENSVAHGWMIIALGVGIAFSYLLWGRLRNAADRFLTPVIVAEIVLLGGSLSFLFYSNARRVRIGSLVGLITVVLIYWVMQVRSVVLAPYWSCATGAMSGEEFLQAGLGATVDLFEQANNLPKDARILCVGEARRYYFRNDVVLSSVFDINPIREAITGVSNAEDIRSRLVAEGYTHLLVNEFEIARLLEFHPPPILSNDEHLMDLRAEAPGSHGEIAEQYQGYVEFGVDALSDSERELYAKFIGAMRGRAYFVREKTSYPAMWISSLGQPVQNASQ